MATSSVLGSGVVLLLCVLAHVGGQYRGGGGGGGGRRSPYNKYETPCQYLTSRPSYWPDNSAPFEVMTRGITHDVRRGKPIEVRIHPWENSIYSFENFTDFVIYAVPVTGAAAAEGGGGEPWRPVGVFAIYPNYAAGGVGFRCNRWAQGYDAVGSVEERHLDVYRMRYPNDPNLRRYGPRQRKGAAFIWFPSEGAMKATAIKFVAFIKIRNDWFRLTSREHQVYNPPSPWETFNMQLQQMARMKQKMRQAEMRANAAEAQAAGAAAAAA